MIFLLRMNILLLFTNVYAQRRISGGREVTVTQKQYMVYLALSEESPRYQTDYKTWLCGGAVITNEHVLTSATCIEDVQRAYVIAGYDKYVPLSDLNTNECTKNMKRRVVVSYTPVEHNTQKNWMKLDIAVVKVEKAFNDAGFTKFCTYAPKEIKVNFDVRRERPGTHVMALGWGHQKREKMLNEEVDLNSKKLRFVSTLILWKERCKMYYKNYHFGDHIDKYMICTANSSILSETGENNDELNREATLAVPQKWEDYRKSPTKPFNIIRTYGICSNDHGGPLVTWINKVETVLGVASVYRSGSSGACLSPDLFTATAVNRPLIDCFVNPQDNSRRSECNNLRSNNSTYKIIRREISWEGYTDSTDDEEICNKASNISTTKIG